MNKNSILCLFLFLLFNHFTCFSQEAGDGLSATVEMQASMSNDKTPLWLNANKYGVSSLNSTYGYLRAAGTYTQSNQQQTACWSAGLDLIAPLGFKDQTNYNTTTTNFILQQAFIAGRYKYGELIIGQKQQPMELKNNELSSGSQTLGINARPIPQIRLGLSDYWHIPGLCNWAAIKTHIAYGLQTDGEWQEEFTRGTTHKYDRNTLYHQKAGYLRIGKTERFPLQLTLGLEMASQFGGTLYEKKRVKSADGTVTIQETANEQSSDLSSFYHAFTGFGAEKKEIGTAYENAEGNHLGSWVFRLDWIQPTYQIGLYGDHFFEDHSAMFFLDYDGYGQGSEWNTKVDNRYFLYDLKDYMLGLEIHFGPKDSHLSPLTSLLSTLVIEYVDTRYQSGPIYHDHTQNISDHVSGRDNYYNHSTFSGWNNYGQVNGNPLYLSPIYNETGSISSLCNRFKAWHVAVAGDPLDRLHYVLKMSWQRGLGTYQDPYLDPQENISLLFEATYLATSCLSLRAAFGMDRGKLRGDNTGCQLTVAYKLK